MCVFSYFRAMVILPGLLESYLKPEWIGFKLRIKRLFLVILVPGKIWSVQIYKKKTQDKTNITISSN